MNLTNGMAMNSFNNQASQLSRSSAHNRAVSLPAFSLQAAQQAQQQNHGFAGLGSGLGYSAGGYGLGVSNEGALPGWAEEEVA